MMKNMTSQMYDKCVHNYCSNEMKCEGKLILKGLCRFSICYLYIIKCCPEKFYSE